MSTKPLAQTSHDGESAAMYDHPAVVAKYEKLGDIFLKMDRVAVAFSAGVDSTLVLRAAIEFLGRDRVVAVTSDSASVPRAEVEASKQLAVDMGVRHTVITTNEFEKEAYLANPTNRCYFCKTTLYSHMAELSGDQDLGVLVNGTNTDDLGDYRPGLQAASEHDVRSPLAEAGLNKAEVRILSGHFGLPTVDKPASPCLSSRVQYGEKITPEKLGMIEAAEVFLREELGIAECRVRHHNNLARIEVHPDQLRRLASPEISDKIDAQFRSLGYQYVTLDLRGFRSGSMNEVIAFGKRQGGD